MRPFVAPCWCVIIAVALCACGCGCNQGTDVAGTTRGKPRGILGHVTFMASNGIPFSAAIQEDGSFLIVNVPLDHDGSRDDMGAPQRELQYESEEQPFMTSAQRHRASAR